MVVHTGGTRVPPETSPPESSCPLPSPVPPDHPAYNSCRDLSTCVPRGLVVQVERLGTEDVKRRRVLQQGIGRRGWSALPTHGQADHRPSWLTSESKGKVLNVEMVSVSVFKSLVSFLYSRVYCFFS
ncbi:hypothetical protein COOONC_22939 [Cooperia oncophora]